MNNILTDRFYDFITLRLLMLANKTEKLHITFPVFCYNLRIENIFRQTDRTSMFLQDHEDFKIPQNVALFTILNSPKNWLLCRNSDYYTIAEFVLNEKPRFHSAYIINGVKKYLINGSNMEDKIIDICDNLNDKTLEDIHVEFISVPGIGNFMAHQIIINLQLRGHLQYSDSYVKLGPGSKKGLKLLELKEKESSLTELLSEIKENELIQSLTPKAVINGYKECTWTLETVENCLCIFQKMIKAMETNKCRRKYSNINTSTAPYIPQKAYVFENIQNIVQMLPDSLKLEINI